MIETQTVVYAALGIGACILLAAGFITAVMTDLARERQKADTKPASKS